MRKEEITKFNNWIRSRKTRKRGDRGGKGKTEEIVEEVMRKER